MIYKFKIFKDGVPTAGLTPIWLSLYDATAGTNKLSSAPTISEIGGGWYKFSLTAGVAPFDVDELVGFIDAGSTLQNNDRYIAVGITIDDERLQNIDTPVSSRLATTGYTAPDNAKIADIHASVNTTENIVYNSLDATISSRLAADDFIAPDNSLLIGIKEKTDTLPASPAATGDAMTLTAGTITTVQSGLATEANATANKTAVLAAIAGTGAGPYTVTITVSDGTNDLQNAHVRLIEGMNIFSGATNVSGQIVFSLDAASYAVSISKAGYTFTPATLAVSGNASPTYAMSQVAITPSADPDVCVCYGTVYDADGSVEPAKTVTFTMTTPPTAKGVYLTGPVSATSGTDGSIQAELIRGAKYNMKIAGKSPVEITIPDEDAYELPSY